MGPAPTQNDLGNVTHLPLTRFLLFKRVGSHGPRGPPVLRQNPLNYRPNTPIAAWGGLCVPTA